MGLQRDVSFTGEMPSWSDVSNRLAAAGLSVTVRMIDGLPAFPDEVPEPGWQELRLSTPGGMVTLRGSTSCLSVVVWGNADAQLLRERDIIATTIAEMTGGTVRDPG
jgi:hypothetical protein